MRTFIVAAALMCIRMAVAQNSTALPACASGCLAHAIAGAATNCNSGDIRCLCSNTNYINTLSCCLATSCSFSDQQGAIQFNIATCNSVNLSAPNFVGCSPSGSSSLSASINTATMSLKSGSMGDMSGTMDMSMASNGLVTTVPGTVSALSTILPQSSKTTATWGTKSLLTGTCTNPYFAAVTDINGQITEFPQVGCASGRDSCCPFDSQEDGVLTQCPKDYFTTASACCPSGWQIYFTELGGHTPCYTMPSITHVPAASPAISGVTVITEHVFTRKYDLVQVKAHGGMSAGAKAGIAIGALIGGLVIISGVIFLWSRKKRAARMVGITATPEVRAITTATTRSSIVQSPVHELPSPDSPMPPRSPHAHPLASHLPPYHHVVSTSPPPPPEQPPQELPGSYFIHEHHPAFSGDENLPIERPGSNGTGITVPPPNGSPMVSPLDDTQKKA